MKAGKDYIGVGVGAFIRNDKGEFLFMKRGPLSKNEIGYWTIPGGAVELSETLQQAVIREIKEEIGVDIIVDNQLPAYDHIMKEENQHWVTNLFLAHIKNGTPKILEPKKCAQMEWFNLNNLPSPISTGIKEGINYLLNK